MRALLSVWHDSAHSNVARCGMPLRVMLSREIECCACCRKFSCQWGWCVCIVFFARSAKSLYDSAALCELDICKPFFQGQCATGALPDASTSTRLATGCKILSRFDSEMICLSQIRGHRCTLPKDSQVLVGWN